MLNLRNATAKKRELAAQIRLAATVERSMVRGLRIELQRVGKAAARAFRSKKSPTSDAVMAPHRAAIKRILVAGWAVSARANARRVLDSIGKSRGMALERKATEQEIDKIIRDFTDEFTAGKVKRITDTTAAHIINAVQSGLSEEIGVSEIADLIEERTGGAISASRAAVIARTEVHAAAQTASVRAADSLNIPGMQKEWVSAEDARTRPTHETVNGLSIAMDDKFIVGDALLDYPGDPSVSDHPEEIINCRCATVFNAPEPGE